jgi:hypothetical protein
VGDAAFPDWRSVRWFSCPPKPTARPPSGTCSCTPTFLALLEGRFHEAAAQARPGEVLVSSTIKDLVAGSSIAFEERGTHELKGVPGEWRLFAVERHTA